MRAKTIGILTFAAGVLISICAFSVDKADRLPIVMRFLAPAYVHAQTGVAKLKSTKALLPSDDGFAEIAKLFFDTAAHENSPEVLALLSVKSFTRQTAMIALGEDRAGEVVPVEVELSNGQKVRWDLKQIE